MKVFALSDPHLSLSGNKSMEVFGGNWSNYMERIAHAWQRDVDENDIVLIPGDICWAMRLSEAKAEFEFLAQLPGQKLIGRGNHDYWWSTNTSALRQMHEWGIHSIRFVKTGAVRLAQDIVLVSTRGWLTPDTDSFKATIDGPIWEREKIRLRLALDQMQIIRQKGDCVICMVHYPPMTSQSQATAMTQLMTSYSVDMCVYGHIHSSRPTLLRIGQDLNGVKYWLSSCDQIDFCPLLLCETMHAELLSAT